MITKKSLENRLSVRQMFFKNLFLLFFFLIGAQQANAQRAMYVTLAKQTVWDNPATPNNNEAEWTSNIFDNTANVPDELISMLEYARDNHVSYLILYKVSEVLDAEHTEGLVSFMNLARLEYCITKIGVNLSSGANIGYEIEDSNGDGIKDALVYYPDNDIITPFNTEQAAHFDALVYEFEFWNTSYPSFELYIELLDKMNNMKQTATGSEATPVQGISEVDVYLAGTPYDVVTGIANTNIFEPISNGYSAKENANRVDNRADNIFISCYQPFNQSANDDGYGYFSFRYFKPLALLLGNTDIVGNNEFSSKSGTKLFPLFAVNSSLKQDGTFSNNYTKSYFEEDPKIGINKTPAEIEEEFFSQLESQPTGSEATVLENNIINKGDVVWFKYEFMPKPTSYSGHTNYDPNYYNANNILFSSNPAMTCNKATFDYSGPNEDGIRYTWNFGDGSPDVVGITSSSNQLASTLDRIHYYQASGNYDVSLRLEYNYPYGCSYTYEKTININVGNIPTLAFTRQGVSDCDASTGSATVYVFGGTISTCVWTDIEGQTISATTGQTSSTASSLPVNTYFVTVTTPQGCLITGSTGIPNNMGVSLLNGSQINTNTIWNTADMDLKGVIYINDGKTLTIDGITVKFAYDVISGNDEGDELVGARFQVENGGTLIIKNGALLTSCGNGVWDGIETRGPNAKVIINTGATIENAKIAIVNNIRTNLGLTTRMGTIEANNAIFKNNRNGVEVIDGNPDTYFKDCEFIFDLSTRFNYPYGDLCCEYSHKEMNFVHLRESSSDGIVTGNGVRFEGNNFKSNWAPAYIHRGRGIQSDKASYSLCSLSGTGDGNNTFSGLGRGIYIVSATSLDIVRIEGNTFDNVMHSVTALGAKNTLIRNNHFLNLSPSEPNMAQFAGISFWGSSAFQITGNDFSGVGNEIDGSNGISISNSSDNAGECLNNRFKTLDYGIHVQENNNFLKIGCNKFSEDGIDHRVSALYISYGILGHQGNSGCLGDPSKAAGNAWLGPNTNLGSSISSFANASYNYYANPSVGFPSSEITNPIVSSISNYTGSLTFSDNCSEVDNFDVNNCTISWLPPLVPNNFESAVDVLNSIEIYNGILISHKEKYRDLYKKQMELIASIEEMFGSIDNADSDWLQQLSALEEQMKFEMDEIEWNSSEIQLSENELIRAYIFFEKFNQLEELLYESKTAESYKILANYYFDINEYEKCREILTYVNDITKEECSYLSEIKAKYKNAENQNFVQFFNLLIELKLKGKTILEADEDQIALLQRIIDAQVQISIKAEFEMSKLTKKEYEHSIIKVEEKQEKKMNVNSTKEIVSNSNLTLYPNPTSNLLTIEYYTEKNSKNSFIEVYDVLGKLKASIRIDAENKGQATLDCSNFANGVYNCVLISDEKVIKSAKLVIVK